MEGQAPSWLLTGLLRYSRSVLVSADSDPAEKRHGRRYLIDQLVGSSTASSSKRKTTKKPKHDRPGTVLAMGYDVLEVKDEAGEEGGSGSLDRPFPEPHGG